MPAMGIPVVLVPCGVPVTAGAQGTPITLVGGNAVAISNAQTLVVPVTGVYVTSATFTVVNGAITGIVLS